MQYTQEHDKKNLQDYWDCKFTPYVFQMLFTPCCIILWKRGNLSKTHYGAFCDIRAGVKFKLSFSMTTWRHFFAKSDNIQDLCECIHKGLQGFLGSPLVPLKHLSTQRELLDDRRSRNVKRRIEGEVLVKREGTPGILVWGGICWGGAGRSESASGSLIW